MQYKSIMIALLCAGVLDAGPAQAGTIADATVRRNGDNSLTISWSDSDPVDVFMADKANATPKSATLISDKDDDGRHVVTPTLTTRPYFLMRDRRTKQVVHVAERLIPLERGSNFRDIGGYPGAHGKHVRWGLIYRSGATPLLTDADVQQVRTLGIRNLVDLRSNEERLIAPTRLDGIPYNAIGYAMSSMAPNPQSGGMVQNGSALYRHFPTLLAPQLRLIFARLLDREASPIAYNCSAGQDRTGFVTAMILTALGVPRTVILQDYHLSTGYRRPENEMAKIDVVAQADNPAAMYFARYQQNPAAAIPQPLYDANHKAFLTDAIDEVEARWGSIEQYLDQEAGVTPADIVRLRAAYLE